MDADKSKVRFKVSHLISSVEGEFHKFAGAVELNEKKITRSQLSVVIHTASVDTGTKALDEELCSDGFLNVRRYPDMTFKAKKITQESARRLKITGDLRIQDVTREVILDAQMPSAPAKDRFGKMRRNVSAVTRISRKSFGLDWDSMMTAGLGDEIDIRLDIELIEK
jgi:polyisoprenoid-binding protein YceI